MLKSLSISLKVVTDLVPLKVRYLIVMYLGLIMRLLLTDHSHDLVGMVECIPLLSQYLLEHYILECRDLHKIREQIVHSVQSVKLKV